MGMPDHLTPGKKNQAKSFRSVLTLFDEALAYTDTEVYNNSLVNRFTSYVNEFEPLKDHRDFVEKHVYGFGERAFYWMWWLVVEEMPMQFRFLEVGVYKGQILSLVKLCAKLQGKECEVVGVTPLSKFAGVTDRFTEYPDEDYMQHILDLHNRFGLEAPTIVKGDSTDEAIKAEVKRRWPAFDVVYIDGCHEFDYVKKDLEFYPHLIKEGGYLVVDDSANSFHMPFGFFQGVQEVTMAVQTVIERDPCFEHLLAVMHNRIWVTKCS